VRQARKVGIKGKYVFIRPPSIQSLEERLRGRNTETEVRPGRLCKDLLVDVGLFSLWVDTVR